MTGAEVASPTAAMSGPSVRVEELHRSFGPTRALRGVSLEVAAGTVHALLGGNGSGKSTLVKILAGVYAADSGTIELAGTRFAAHAYKASDGLAHGLRFVHQDLGLIDTASIAENMAFARGFPCSPGRRIDWRKLRESTAVLLRQYEIDATPETLVANLRPADRTMVAIARALGDENVGAEARRVLVLDEPTASLPRHESELLLGAVRRRAALGQTVILISHHLGEVLEVADVITVLRDGIAAGTLPAKDADEEAVVALIAGRAVAALGRREDRSTSGSGRLRVRALSAGPLQDIHLDIAAGEIVGVTGLLGSGRSSLVRAIFGELRRRSGTVEVDGRALAGSGAAEAMANGVAFVPEDRAGEATFPDHSVSDNLSAAVLRRYWRRALMKRSREHSDSRELIDRFGIRAAGPGLPLSTLSGGNQQKTVLARWLRREPRVLLLDEPTQGVDVVSRADIYRLVRAAAAAGCAVLVASSDTDELAILCDRVIVLARGEIAAHVDHEQLDADLLVSLTQRVTPSTATSAAGASS